PKDITEYVHRIGRTGRVGNAGRSTSFINLHMDSSIIRPLVLHLIDAKQAVPEWMKDNCGTSESEMF
ncbi:hypothetical protein PMAYCL1PPCAC_24974, partial [Pristionchus mayeri]